MDVKVFDTYTSLALTEYLAQDVDKFNEASKGTIKIEVQPTKGNFDIKASFASINGITRRRNAYSSDNIERKRLSQIQNVGVKVGVGTPTLEWTKQEYLWTQQSPELASTIIAEQLSKGVLGDMLNTGLLGLSAALKVQEDVFCESSPDIQGLVNAAAAFGDRASAIKAWAVHSGFSNQLINYALQNGYHLFSYETVNILKDPYGRTFIITDCPSLIEMQGKTAQKYFAVGLVENAIKISQNADFNSEIIPELGKENIGYNYQAEWSYNLTLKGYAWDIKNGGASPTDTAIGTGINWLKTASSIKDTAGVILQAHPEY